MKTIKPGETVLFTQKDGNVIRVMATNVSIIIKAENIGTELHVERCTSIAVSTKAVCRG